MSEIIQHNTRINYIILVYIHHEDWLVC